MTAESVLFSWTLEPLVAVALVLTGLVYWRGWRRLSRQLPSRFPVERLLSFLAGLGAVYTALASPLDAFAGWLLIVHMVQHLMLTMVAPPLILLGFPMLPLLSGLPRPFVRSAIGPFLKSPLLHRIGRFLVHPFFAGPLFIISNLAWHTPALYGLALSNPSWHRFEHLCFLGTALLFWWPVVQPWPSRPALPRWAMIPYLLAADLQNTALAGFLTFCERVVYPEYAAAPRISGLSALEDQAGAGAVMWVPGSIAFLIPAGLIAMSYLAPRRRRSADAAPERLSAPPPPRRFDLLLAPIVGPIMRWKFFRPCVQMLMLSLAALIVIDGLWGPQVAPMNLAGTLPWTHWRAMTVAALLIAGNFFCMACPFVFVRDIGRRLLPANRTWPRALRSKWLAAALLAGFFWAYEFFDLWDSPWWTAWIVIFYFCGAFVIDGFFKNASFCKYVCPIGQFQFLSSLASPLEVRVREPDVCSTCRTRDCIRGNDGQRGCELLLFQPRKSGNMDCTFCLDCVHACPHDNVGILAVAPGADLISNQRRSSVGSFDRRPDLAALAMVFVSAAFVNAAGMTAPATAWEQALRSSLTSGAAGVVWSLCFVLLVTVVPAALAIACGALSSIAADRGPLAIASAFAPALAPLGFSMWIAHFSFHFLSGLLAPWPVFQRILHDLGFGVTPNWNIPSPPYGDLPGFQIFILNAGLLFCLWILWRKSTAEGSRRTAIFLPWAIFAGGLYAAGIWLFFQPMDMRGAFMP